MIKKIIIILIFICFVPSLVIAKNERIIFQSIKTSGFNGEINLHKVWGYLNTPKDHNGSVVVLSHGSGGITSNSRNWAKFLNNNGYGTLLIDHFKSRGVSQTLYNQESVSVFEMSFDILAAGNYLKKKKKIYNKIFHIGWSKGAIAGLISASDSYQRKIYSDVYFSGFIEFYPLCNIWLPGGLSSSVKIIHGELDNYTHIIFCKKYVKEMRSRSSNKDIIDLISIPNAHHSFDNWDLQEIFLPVNSIRKYIDDCILIYNDNINSSFSLSRKFELLNLSEYKKWIKHCSSESGVTIKGHPRVKKSTEKLVLSILKKE